MDKAFVTLLTTPSYLPGVLVLLHSLIALHPAPRDFKIVCLVTPETVDARTIGEVRKAGFDLVIGVEPIGSGAKGQDALGLMGRPDLNLALSKLHLFRLSPLFQTIIYLDADVLPLRPLSHLFESTHPHILSACPDTGWPDCFNSGVMVIRPREADFEGMRALLKAAAEGETSGAGGNGSFDGADQGLFNEWFSEEGGGGDWNRLSFTYNVTPSAAYQYAPAYKRYGHKISAVHFIGASKPWSNILYRPAGISNVQGKDGVFDYPSLIDRWYAIYDAHVRPSSAHAPDVASRFTVPETLAIWNRSAPTGGIPQQPSDRMDLEALKAATEYGFAGVNSGTYTSLPLDGRVDLMMPKPELKPASAKRVSFKEGEGLAQMAHNKIVDLAQTPASPTIHHSPATPSSPVSHQPQSQQSTWDAAHYSPPKEGRPEMDNAQISYYQNAWDQPASQQSSYFPAQAEKSEPQYPTLPANVRNDNWYSHFTSGPLPDRSAIQPVFPWEEKKEQRRPDRVFPRGSTPPPMQQSSSHLQVKPTLVVQQPTPPGPMPSAPPYTPPPPSQPMSLSEAMASYRNAWDSDPSIQKYISKITGVSQPERDPKSIEKGLQSVPATPRISPEELTERREMGLSVHSHHETRSDASGDGDDEDDGEDEDEGGRRVGGRKRGNPRYRDNGAQTDRSETNDVGAQWTGSTGLSPVVRTFDIRQTQRDSDSRYTPSSTGRDSGLGIPSTTTNDTRRGSSTSGSDSTISSLPPKPRRIPFPVSQPSTDRIPRRTSQTAPIAFTSALSPGQSPTASTFSIGGYETGPPNVAQAGTGNRSSALSSRRESFNTSTPSASGRRFPPVHVRRGSESVESDAITANGEPKTRASRMFDPSTDVDVRKRDTQEVLSRFMRGANAAGGGNGKSG